MYVVDLSSYQGTNPPLSLLKQQHGVAGVIVKLTQGDNYRSPDAPSQLKKARQLGMEVGVYLFEDPRTPAANTVNYMLDYVSACGGLLPGETIFVDFETPGGLNGNQCREWLIEAEAELDKRAPGQIAGVYGSNSFLNGIGIDSDPWADYRVWVADYGAHPTIAHYDGWQFTDSYAGMGIDCSIFPGGLRAHPVPAPEGKMTHALWLVALQYVHTHFAPANWATAWTDMTSNPANTYQILVDHHLV